MQRRRGDRGARAERPLLGCGTGRGIRECRRRETANPAGREGRWGGRRNQVGKNGVRERKKKSCNAGHFSFAGLPASAAKLG